MPPGVPDDEDLEEIDDEAIVAQQAAAHAPAPRAQVTEEARTIVVEEPPPAPGDTARLRAIRARGDPTMVVRAVRAPYPYPPSIPPMAPYAAPRSVLPSWLPWVIWAVAGLIAFAIGGVLAVMVARRDRPPPAPDPGRPPATARPSE